MATTYAGKSGAMPQFDNSVTPSGKPMGGSEAGGIAKYKWYIIAAVGGIVLILYIRARSASSTAGTAAPNPTGTLGGSADPTAALNTISGDLAQILANTSAGSTSTTGTGSTGTGTNAQPPSVGDLMGSGYGVQAGQQIIAGADANYQYISTQAQVNALGGYKNLFFQPIQGVFQPWNPGLAPGTPMFFKTPYAATPPPPPKT